jgi:hypothetical protein
MSDKLDEARKNLRDYINKNPQVRQYQRELELEMLPLKNPQDRLIFLLRRMTKKMNELKDILNDLPRRTSGIEGSTPPDAEEQCETD